MGRLFFGVILGVIGLLYLAAAVMAVMPRGFLAASGTVDMGTLFGGFLFLVVGAAAAVASVNLLREKRR
ncbi:MAG TPA: hypothetical protein VM536_11960 [Chloroflexia bacterium]|nr:hypothetical protein [Chloroflexia bacterium]